MQSLQRSSGYQSTVISESPSPFHPTVAQCLQGSHQNESPRSRHIHSCKARFHLRIGNAMHGIAYVRVKSDHPKRSLPISSSLLARTFHPQATMWYSSISHVPPLKKPIRCRKFKMKRSMISSVQVASRIW